MHKSYIKSMCFLHIQFIFRFVPFSFVCVFKISIIFRWKFKHKILQFVLLKFNEKNQLTNRNLLCTLIGNGNRNWHQQHDRCIHTLDFGCISELNSEFGRLLSPSLIFDCVYLCVILKMTHTRPLIKLEMAMQKNVQQNHKTSILETWT